MLKSEYLIKTQSEKGQVGFEVNIFNPPDATKERALEIARPQIAKQLDCQFEITGIELIRRIYKG